MIASLRGRVLSRSKDALVLDVHGVGYRVFMSQPGMDALRDGEEAFVHVHTSVREDAIHLFGFTGEVERDVFLALNLVTGIGPKVALGILSGTTTHELVSMVVSGDLKGLTRLPGVGKKTAERIVVELKEPLARIVPGSATSRPTAPSRSGTLVDVASALANLGYRTAQIDRALAAVSELAVPPADFDSALREALKNLR